MGSYRVHLNFLALLLGFALAFPLVGRADEWGIYSSTEGWDTYVDTCGNYVAHTSDAGDCEGSYYVFNYPASGYSAWSGSQYCQYYPGCDAPPSPSENGILDNGEDGIDCGGTTGVECVPGCPPGYPLYYDLMMCTGDIVPVNAFNSCPAGFTKEYFAGVVECYQDDIPATLASQAYFDANPIPEVTDPPPAAVTGNITFTSMAGPEVVVDNGDGTETATVVNTVTDSGGNVTGSSSVTVNRPSGSAVGTGFAGGSGGAGGVSVAPGYGGESTTETPSEGIVGATSAPGELDFGSRIGDALQVLGNNFESYVDQVRTHELVDLVTVVFTPPVSVPADSFSVDMGAYGVQVIDMASSDNLYGMLSKILQACAFITGVYIVFRKA